MRFAASALAGIGILVAGCSPSHQIGNHVFVIPREYVVSEVAPGLPRPESEGVLVTLNPKEEPRKSVSALVETKSQVCGHQTAFERPVCKPSPLWTGDNWNQPAKLQRRADPRDGSTQWEYVAVIQGEEVIIAGCFGPVNKGGGLCYTAVRYSDDLFVKIGYPEARLPDLRALITGTQRLLSRWER